MLEQHERAADGVPLSPRRPVTPIEQRSRVGDGRSGTEGRQRVQQLDTRQWECRDRLGDRCRAHQSRGQVVQTAQGRPPVGIRPVVQDLGQSVGRAIGQPRGQVGAIGHRDIQPAAGGGQDAALYPVDACCSRALRSLRPCIPMISRTSSTTQATIDVTKKMPDKAFDTSMTAGPKSWLKAEE